MLFLLFIIINYVCVCVCEFFISSNCQIWTPNSRGMEGVSYIFDCSFLCGISVWRHDGQQAHGRQVCYAESELQVQLHNAISGRRALLGFALMEVIYVCVCVG